MDSGFLSVILILAAVGIIFIILSLLFTLILNSISNPILKKLVFVFLSIAFLPIILFSLSVGRITDAERILGPFSFSLHVRSKLIVITLFLYIGLYYVLYEIIFKGGL